jgi:Zn-dependent protease
VEAAPEKKDPPKPSGIRFTLFGIPIVVNLSFFLVGAVLLYGSTRDWSSLFTTIAIFAVTLLWHELGHAAAFKIFGHDPEIRLMGLMGLTWSRSGKEVTPGQTLLISAAGPLAGLLLAGICFVIADAFFIESRVLREFMVIGLVINVVNLLPMLPLDGGQIMKSFLLLLAPGGGARVAHGISLLVCGATLWFAMTHGLEVAALLLLCFMSMNFSALRSETSQPVAA